MDNSNLSKEDFKTNCNFVSDTFARMSDDKEVPSEIMSLMRELKRKSDRLMALLESDTNEKSQLTEKIIEVEQAADSLKAATKSSEDLSESVKAQLMKVHDRLSLYKQEAFKNLQ